MAAAVATSCITELWILIGSAYNLFRILFSFPQDWKLITIKHWGWEGRGILSPISLTLSAQLEERLKV